MRKVPLLVAVLFSLGLASSALAAGYGAAGCGLGGFLIKDNNTILAQLGATILNSVSGNQTFAISSGTLGCGESGLVLAKLEQEVFVEKNYFNLAKDMATGEGEDLTVLAGLLGCSGESVVTFSSFTQGNYSSIFVSEETTPLEMLGYLKGELAGHPQLSTSCLNL